MTELGSYYIVYAVKDQSGRYNETTVTLIVSDNNPPSLSLSEGYNKNTVVYVSKGTTLSTVSYQTVDDFDEEVQVLIVVYAPDNTFQIIGKSGEFKVTQIGDYKVHYCAYDKAGNYTSMYYTVRVQ